MRNCILTQCSRRFGPLWWCINVLLGLSLVTIPSVAQQVAKPVFVPKSANTTIPFALHISSATQGASIYYTIDDTVPTQASIPLPVSGVITIGCNLVVQARAFKSGMTDSDVQREAYSVTGIIEGGGAHVLALKADGSLWAWGANNNGRLGNGTATGTGNIYAAPSAVKKRFKQNGTTITQDFTDAADIFAGNAFGVVVDQGRFVYTFGDNTYDQLGHNSWADDGYAERVLKNNVTYANAADTDFLGGCIGASAGLAHAVALEPLNSDGSGGRVWAWGSRLSGRIGDNYTSTTASSQHWAKRVDMDDIGTGSNDLDGSGFADLQGVIQVSAGQAFTLAIGQVDASGRGQVWAWGDNSSGQAGQGTVAVIPHARRVKFDSSATTWPLGAWLNDAIEVAAGNDHCLAIRQDANGVTSVWCWGQQANGRLGNGVLTTASKSYPGTTYASNSVYTNTTSGLGVHWQDALGADQGQLQNIIHVAAGPRHSLALKSDGTVWAWGFNQDGNLGDNTITNRSLAVKVSVPLNVGGNVPFIVAIGAGGVETVAGDGTVTVNSQSYAVDSDGNIYGWGYNGHGEVGNGSLSTTVPVKTPQLSPYTLKLSNRAPVISSLTLDTHTTYQPGAFTFTATISDPELHLSHIDFYGNGSILGSVDLTPGSNSSYTIPFRTPPTLAAGTYNFLAVGVDQASGMSSAIPTGGGASVIIPTVSFATAPTPATTEGGAPAVARISRNGSTGALAVHYSAAGAYSTNDFSTSGVATIPDGATYVDLPVTAFEDNLSEPDETVTLQIQSDPAYDLGTSIQSTITIHDATIYVSAAESHDAYEFNTSQGYVTIRTNAVRQSVPLTATLTVGGTAQEGVHYQSISHTVTIPAGQSSVQVPIVAIEDDIFNDGESVQISIASAGATITGGPGTSLIHEDIFWFSGPHSDATRAWSNGYFTVGLEGQRTTRPIVAHYTIDTSASNAAVNGTDYILSGSVTIPVGVTRFQIPLNPLEILTPTGTKTVTLAVLPGAGSYWGSALSKGTINILDAPATVGIIAPISRSWESASIPGKGKFTVFRTGDVTQALTVPFARSGSAALTTDYTLGSPATSTSVTIPAGSADVSFDLVPVRNVNLRGELTATLTVTPTANLVAKPSSASITIGDYDTKPTFTVIALTSNAIQEEGGPVNAFLIHRTGNLYGSVNVWLLFGGTATSGSDYVPSASSIVFPDGVDSATVTITPIDDTLVEGTETVVLSLDGSPWYQSGSPASATVNLVDIDPAVTTPILSPTGGNYGLDPLTVSVSCSTTGAVIHYTLNGREPSESDPTIISGNTLTVTERTVIKAKAWKSGSGLNPSVTASQNFNLTGAVAAGATHSVAVLDDGTVWAWGDNSTGALANTAAGTAAYAPVQSLTATGVPLSGAREACAGLKFSVVRMADSTVFAWGTGNSGELGNNSTVASAIPQAVLVADPLNPTSFIPLGSVKSLAAGDSHVLALRTDGTLWAWGSNSNGQIGTGSSGGTVNVATQVFLPASVIGIAAGGHHSMALLSTGSVYAWGSNNHGQLGVGDLVDRNAPVLVKQNSTSALSAVGLIGAGGNHSFAVGTNGTSSWAWGTNALGESFISGTSDVSFATVADLDSQTVRKTAIGLGKDFTLLTTSAGTISTRGASANGQLGLGSATSGILTPPAPFAKISAGADHSLAIAEDGSVWGWGNNVLGAVGNGSAAVGVEFVIASVPVQITKATDTDADGVPDRIELLSGGDIHSTDSDGDGVSDLQALRLGHPLYSTDYDGDGLTNAQEAQLGTNPFVADSDGDGVPDAQDAFPLDPTRSTLGTSDSTAPVITLTLPVGAEQIQ